MHHRATSCTARLHNPKDIDYNEKRTDVISVLLMVAGMGFEPHDLRVMSPMSYLAALPRDIKVVQQVSLLPTYDSTFNLYCQVF